MKTTAWWAIQEVINFTGTELLHFNADPAQQSINDFSENKHLKYIEFLSYLL